MAKGKFHGLDEDMNEVDKEGNILRTWDETYKLIKSVSEPSKVPDFIYTNSNDEANKICARCRKPFYSLDEMIFHCDDCLDYRATTLSTKLGEATKQLVSYAQKKECPQCSGYGKLGSWGNKKTCSMCHGAGEVENYDRVRENWTPGGMNSPNVSYDGGRIPHNSLKSDVDVDATLEPLTDEMKRLVKSKLPSDFDSKCCYITSACLEDLGLPLNSLEMKAMKILTRENILKSFKGKRDYISYGKKAPEIVKAIRSKPESKQIWKQVYQSLNDVTSAVAFGRYEEGYEQYKSLVVRLANQF